MRKKLSEWKITSSFGAGNSIFLSIRPGLNRALSKISIRLVAMMTLMFCVGSKPSNWFNNSNMVLCTSLSPVVIRVLRVYREQIFTKSIVVGLCSYVYFFNKSDHTEIYKIRPRYIWLDIYCFLKKYFYLSFQINNFSFEIVYRVDKKKKKKTRKRRFKTPRYKIQPGQEEVEVKIVYKVLLQEFSRNCHGSKE